MITIQVLYYENREKNKGSPSEKKYKCTHCRLLAGHCPVSLYLKSKRLSFGQILELLSSSSLQVQWKITILNSNCLFRVMTNQGLNVSYSIPCISSCKRITLDHLAQSRQFQLFLWHEFGSRYHCSFLTQFTTNMFWNSTCRFHYWSIELAFFQLPCCILALSFSFLPLTHTYKHSPQPFSVSMDVKFPIYVKISTYPM